MTDTFETNSRPTFRERVYALAGHSTWREPVGSFTSQASQIPSDHLVAAALAFGRRNPRDIGPDIAFDIVTGRPGHYLRCCEWAGRAIAHDRGAPARRALPWAGVIAVTAYNALVRGYSVPPCPAGLAEKDWQELVLFACLLLDYAAEDALALAARRNRRAG